MRREKERADQQAKLEAAIRHIKRDSPKMQSQDFPPTFMTTFERNVNEQAIPLKDWASCFLHCLGGSDANIYSTLIDSSPDSDCWALKALFLSRVGHDWSTNALFIAFKKKPYRLSYEQYFHEMVLRVRQLVVGAKDVVEAVDWIVKAGFTNFLQGMKRSELCVKRDLPVLEFGKFLGECDSASTYHSPRRESQFPRRPFNSIEPTTQTLDLSLCLLPRLRLCSRSTAERRTPSLTSLGSLRRATAILLLTTTVVSLDTSGLSVPIKPP